MTFRNPLRFRLRFLVVPAATVALGLSMAGAAVAAPSGGTPGPTPSPTCTQGDQGGNGNGYGTDSPSPDFGYNPNPCPTPPPRPRIAQEDIGLTITNEDQAGDFMASGPIVFDHATDTQLSPTLDRFSEGADSITVKHSAFTFARVDRLACAIEVVQNDQRWRIVAGTGRDRFAFGAGVYDLVALFDFPTKDFRCTLPYGLNGWQAAWDLDHNVGLPQPFDFDISVSGTGFATTNPLCVPVVKPWQMPGQDWVTPPTDHNPNDGCQTGNPNPHPTGTQSDYAPTA